MRHSLIKYMDAGIYIYHNSEKRLGIKIITIVFTIFILVCIAISLQALSHPVTLSVIPEVPREGEPLMLTYKINNPSQQESTVQYQLFANGRLIEYGETKLAPLSCERHRYTYKNPLKLGEQVTFLIKTSSDKGEYEKALSLPAYPPQIWSSFVSFASFSTSVMSSMSSMAYYKSSFGSEQGLNIGMIISIVLIILLTYLGLSEPLIKKTMTIIGYLRIEFSRLSAILFILFISMVFTEIVMILAT